MDLLDLTSHYVAGAALLAIAIAFVLFQPTGLVKWLQKKNYQYEVTFALYMLTPTEKFIFNSILFLSFSMLATACILYPPDHVSTISKRLYYYFAGDTTLTDASRELSRTAASHIGGTASRASEAMFGAASDIAGAALKAAVNTAAAAQEAAGKAAEGLGWT